MKLYEIINPSDEYTMEAEDFREAAVALLSISTAFGLREIGNDKGQEMPPFIFGGMDAWLKEHICPDGDVQRFMAEHNSGIAAALNSVLIGGVRDRRLFQAAMEAIPDAEAREAFRVKWQDEKRTSTNDIGAAAWAMAEHITGRTRTE